MSRQDDPADARLLVMFLRSLRRWSQEDLARAAGLERSSISDYEAGVRAPRPRMLARLASAAGLPESYIAMLLPVFRAARLAVENRPAGGNPEEADVAASLADGLEQAIYDAVLPSLTPFVLELESLLEESEEEREAPDA